MPDALRKIAEAAAQILADVRAGNHPHGDIRDAGRVLTGKWDQDFPTAVLGLGQAVLALLDQQEQQNATIERMRAALERAAVQFAYYAVSHYAKGTADGNEKAAVNAEFASEMRAALEPTHD